MSSTAIRVRPLLEREVPRAAETLSEAFDDDPVFRFMLRERPRRQAWLRWFHEASLREAMLGGGAFTVGEGPSAAAMAVVAPASAREAVTRVARSVGLLPALPTWALVRSGLPLYLALRGRHPPEPHLYLSVIGVHPSRQGRGVGGALLRHLVSEAGARGLPCHLETAKPSNVSLYERFGFRVVGEVAYGGAPPTWAMTRALSFQ